MRELFQQYNIVAFPCGNTGTQMAGWYRKEIKSVADLKGLKMRVAGLAGQILARLGVVPQQIGGADIYPALEKGTIDAAEWVGPYDDEKLGFHKVARYYYYPGWWEGSAQLSIYVNAKHGPRLRQAYQEALEVACAEANVHMLARYDAKNTEALRRLVAGGAQLRAFPRPVHGSVLQGRAGALCRARAEERRIQEDLRLVGRFREDQYLWFRVAEKTFDNFVYSVRKPAPPKKS